MEFLNYNVEILDRFINVSLFLLRVHVVPKAWYYGAAFLECHSRTFQFSTDVAYTEGHAARCKPEYFHLSATDTV